MDPSPPGGGRLLRGRKVAAKLLSFLTLTTHSMITDFTALSFEIPARDALGREHVEGKLVAAEACLQFYWRFRDRTFKRTGDDMRLIEVDYTNVESVVLKTTFFWFNPRLLLKLADPRPLGEVPGTRVGAATLMLTGSEAVEEARTFLKMMDYRKSDAIANARITRMSDLDDQRRSL